MDLIVGVLIQSPLRWGQRQNLRWGQSQNLRYILFGSSVEIAAFVCGCFLASMCAFTVFRLWGIDWRDWRMHPLRRCTFLWIELAGLIPFIAALWAGLSPVSWDPMGTWSMRLRIVDDVLIILVHGKASRFCNIHTKLNSKLFRSVLWVVYGCAILQTATLLITEWAMGRRSWDFSVPSMAMTQKMIPSIDIAQKMMNLVTSLASLLVSVVTWRHSKAKSTSASIVYYIVWATAALSLRAVSEVIVVIILRSRIHRFDIDSVGAMVSLDLCLGVYTFSTAVIYIYLLCLATLFQDSTISSAVDRYGYALDEESDGDFGQIRLL